MNEVISTVSSPSKEANIDCDTEQQTLVSSTSNSIDEMKEILKRITDAYYNLFENHPSRSTEYHATDYFKRFYAKELNQGTISIYDERILSHVVYSYSWNDSTLFDTSRHFKQFRQLEEDTWRNYALISKSADRIAVLDLDHMAEVTELQIEGPVVELHPIQEIISTSLKSIYQEDINTLNEIEESGEYSDSDVLWINESTRFWSKELQNLKECSGRTAFFTYSLLSGNETISDGSKSSALREPKNDLRLGNFDLSEISKNVITVETHPLIVMPLDVPLERTVRVNQFDPIAYSIVHESLVIL